LRPFLVFSLLLWRRRLRGGFTHSSQVLELPLHLVRNLLLSLSLSLPLHIHGLHILRRLFRRLDDDDAAYDFVLVGRKAFVHVVGEDLSNWNPSAKS
jgi:hypothetical protein